MANIQDIKNASRMIDSFIGELGNRFSDEVYKEAIFRFIKKSSGGSSTIRPFVDYCEEIKKEFDAKEKLEEKKKADKKGKK